MTSAFQESLLAALPGHDEQPIKPAEIFARLNIASPRQDQRTLLSVSLRRLAARDLVERIGDPALTPKNVGYLWRRAKPPPNRRTTPPRSSS